LAISEVVATRKAFVLHALTSQRLLLTAISSKEQSYLAGKDDFT
jgi:hypothetical protein